MMKSSINLYVLVLLVIYIIPISLHAQEKKKPPQQVVLTSKLQELNKVNSVPKNVTTEIIAVDVEGRKKAQKIIELYKVLSNKPTIEKVKKYVSDKYVQHSPMLPDGPEGLAMFFHGLNAQYPVKIDVYRVMVVGNWAMAHVNFRNLDNDDPNDLGNAGVDIYTFGSDGKLLEHWDAVQGVPTYSVNPNGMFLRVHKK